jgi:hypothetical protein
LGKPAVHQENVYPVVLVVVKEGGAAACSLKQIFVAVLAAEDGLHVESGFLGYIRELDAERRTDNWRHQAFGRWSNRCFVGLAGVGGGVLRLGSLLAIRRLRQAQHIFQRQDDGGPGERL